MEVRVRLKSTGMTPLAGPDQGETKQPRERERSRKAREPEERPRENESSGSPLNVIKGLFGF